MRNRFVRLYLKEEMQDQTLSQAKTNEEAFFRTRGARCGAGSRFRFSAQRGVPRKVVPLTHTLPGTDKLR